MDWRNRVESGLWAVVDDAAVQTDPLLCSSTSRRRPSFGLNLDKPHEPKNEFERFLLRARCAVDEIAHVLPIENDERQRSGVNRHVS